MNEAVQKSAAEARELLNEHTLKTVHWHFSDDTGSPFWLEKKRELNFDPLTEVKSFDDLKKFPLFEDDWLRGGPVRRWVPKGHEGKPTYVFETGGTTGVPKSRVVIEDHWKDYEMFSDTLAGRAFSAWRELADVRPEWPASFATFGRTIGPASRRHLVLHRLGSTLGRQADQERLDGAS